MTALALMIGPTRDGWAVYLTDEKFKGAGASTVTRGGV